VMHALCWLSPCWPSCSSLATNMFRGPNPPLKCNLQRFKR
jgi:hypothetical protein